jgi:hypothetical protein
LVGTHVRGARSRERLTKAIADRFAVARFPFRHDRLVPRITVHASVGEISLDPGVRTQSPWTDEAKRALITRGYKLTSRELAARNEAVA